MGQSPTSSGHGWSDFPCPPNRLYGKVWEGGLYFKPLLAAFSAIENVCWYSFMKSTQHNAPKWQMSLCILLQTQTTPYTKKEMKCRRKESCPAHDWDISILQSLFFFPSLHFQVISWPFTGIFSHQFFTSGTEKKIYKQTQWPGWCCSAQPALPACYFWLDPFKLVDGSASLIYTYLLNSIWQRTQQLSSPPLRRPAEGLMQTAPRCPLNGRKCDGNGCESLLLEERKEKEQYMFRHFQGDLCKRPLQTEMRTAKLHTEQTQYPFLILACSQSEGWHILRWNRPVV